MSKKYKRKEILGRIRRQIEQNRPIVVTGAGIGLTAKSAEKAGVDLIVFYNSGKFRMDGLASTSGMMPYSSANEVVIELATRILPVIHDVPAIAGICGTDPTREMRFFLKQLEEMGISGVINFPTVGRIEGSLRRDLEAINLGFYKEVEMIELARSMDLFTMAYVFKSDDARSMVEAGVDVIVPHVGLTIGGSIGAKESMTLERAARATQEMIEVARSVNVEVIPICHGGPISTPENVAYMYQHTDVVGFVGASSIERIPVERAIEKTIRELKEIPIKKGNS